MALLFLEYWNHYLGGILMKYACHCLDCLRLHERVVDEMDEDAFRVGF
jgi:hypothetical protein